MIYHQFTPLHMSEPTIVQILCEVSTPSWSPVKHVPRWSIGLQMVVMHTSDACYCNQGVGCYFIYYFRGVSIAIPHSNRITLNKFRSHNILAWLINLVLYLVEWCQNGQRTSVSQKKLILCDKLVFLVNTQKSQEEIENTRYICSCFSCIHIKQSFLSIPDVGYKHLCFWYSTLLQLL